jgi:hypothetical protein
MHGVQVCPTMALVFAEGEGQPGSGARGPAGRK